MSLFSNYNISKMEVIFTKALIYFLWYEKHFLFFRDFDQKCCILSQKLESLLTGRKTGDGGM
jgi:hypothetical protein